MDLTALIITKNAGDTLRNTLTSLVGLACKTLIIDNYSTDNTLKIGREFGAEIISHHEENFGKQRAFALSQVVTKWTLILDSDEVLTKENRDEIEKAIKNEAYSGYHLHFRNHLFGKKLVRGELHKKLVLFKTGKASIAPSELHEQYEVQGKVGKLHSEILHYSYRSPLQIMKKFYDYSNRQAKQYKREQIKYGLRELLLNPVHMFYARFIKDEGYKDGIERVFLDYQFAHMEFLSYFLIPFVKTKKRIGVDCGAYPVGGVVQSGIDRLLQGIYQHQKNEHDYYWFSFSGLSKQSLPKQFFSQLWLPIKTIINRCDVFLGVGGTIPFLLRLFSIKKILFLYDFGFFTSPDKYNSSAKRLQNQTNSSIKIADKIILLNEEMHREFVLKYPEYAYKAEVIISGADHLKSIEEKPVFIKPAKPVVLYVGVVKPVKRIDKILSVVEENYCIIAGPQEEEYRKSLSIGKTQNIQFIKNFNDGQLKWLYSHSDVMVYASEHEGFCYPVLEALIAGLPVIAFDLHLFHIYKKYFSHLVLVESEKQMKAELKNIHKIKVESSTSHPYTWSSFSGSLMALWQPTLLPRLKIKIKKIAFIFVLYNTSNEEKKRLEGEIKKMGVESYNIYWIDNTSNGKGYAAGINEGIRMGLIDKCDQFVALNPDISLEGISARDIGKVSDEFDVWGFAMKQNSILYYGGEIDPWRLSGGLVTTKPKQQFSSVDFVSGSVMGFSKNVVQTIGLWDESYFMYYEDVDYCTRAQKAGFQVGIDSKTIYDHFEVSQINQKKEKWIAKSRWKFFWKYSTLKQKLREVIRLPKTIIEQ